MSRLPELEHELVAAAVRLRRPSRRLGPAVRVALAATAVAAAAALTFVTAEDSGPPSKSPTLAGGESLKDLFAVFRRPRTERDRTGARQDRLPGQDLGRSRRVTPEGASGFVWPMANGVCYGIGSRSGPGAVSGCAKLADLRPHGLSIGTGLSRGTFSVGGIAVDGIREVRLTTAKGLDVEARVRDNAFFVSAPESRSAGARLHWSYRGRKRSSFAGDVLPPPVSGPEALPGTLSKPFPFQARGRRYTAQGFRSPNSLLCVAMSDANGRPASSSCQQERFVRKALRQRPALLAGAGGAPNGLVHTGFARADVTGLSARTANEEGEVVLSEPWRPRRGSAPVRFFFVFLSEPARFDPRHLPHVSLTARLEDGRSIEIP
jgi:hypothetical protein